EILKAYCGKGFKKFGKMEREEWRAMARERELSITWMFNPILEKLWNAQVELVLSTKRTEKLLSQLKR
ncbi:MAG: hypothetical protein AAF620_06910, partial [Bacteroidota bacterium]